jgi:hypothetical protein
MVPRNEIYPLPMEYTRSIVPVELVANHTMPTEKKQNTLSPPHASKHILSLARCAPCSRAATPRKLSP